MTVDQIALLVFCGIFLTYLAGVVMGVFIGRAWEQDKRALRDIADAEQMRASIRDYDDRVEQFAPQASVFGQSTSLLAGAPPTKSASPLSRRCSRGPEICCCEECTAKGLPPRP